MKTCQTCGKEWNPFSFLEVKGPDIHALLCSPSCLVEWAWKLKESQIKLSKSKEADDEM